jgi:hypothetical protein
MTNNFNFLRQKKAAYRRAASQANALRVLEAMERWENTPIFSVEVDGNDVIVNRLGKEIFFTPDHSQMFAEYLRNLKQ